MMLFYHDIEMEGEYTLVRRIEDSPEFEKAVEDNPVLEDWGNKIISVKSRN